jgi:hypothetical protein
MKAYRSLPILLAALTTQVSANTAQTQLADDMAPGKLYVGAFGGFGSSNHIKASQHATAFFREAIGGPLAVDAFGHIQRKKGPLYGLQLGYQTQTIPLCSSSWSLGPAFELEGFLMKKRRFNGELINDTARLPEHDFLVSYSMKRSVFLGNAVVNFYNPCFCVHPYVGFGIGGAVLRITHANATQISPPEPGINHYNSHTSDSNSAFAGQIKLGLSYDINECVSLFAEYRRLYIASTHFVFGSTVYPNHAATSSWQVNLRAQKYNLGVVGIKFSW